MMKFGLFGGPARTTAGQTDRESYNAYVESVVLADQLGFFGAYLVEHHFTGRGQVSASLGLLIYLAGKTTAIRLGTAVVVVPWHNPVLLAEQAATLDVLSDGRLDLGLGRGYRDNEFESFGIPRHEAPQRFEETLAFLRQAWLSEERFSFDGRFWSFKDIVIEPRPVQRPFPPMWVGAASRGSIEHAASSGLRLFLDQVATFDEIGERVAIYRDAQAKAGIDSSPDDIAVTRPLLLVSEEVSRKALLERQLVTLKTLSDSTAKSAENPFYSAPEHRKERVEASAILGDAAECTQRLDALARLGVHQVLFTRTTPSVLRAFHAEVMPSFAPAATALA